MERLGFGRLQAKISIPLLIVLFLGGCATGEIFRDREEVYGKNPPSITGSFASKTIRPGETWKVYLRAVDPDGDFDSIVAEIHQPGQGTYPASYTRIGAGKGKELSGFVYLNTMTPSGFTWQEYVTLDLTLRIRDKAGHLSQPVVFPLSFSGRYTQEEPPGNAFSETNLGPIMITLRHYATDGPGGFE